MWEAPSLSTERLLQAPKLILQELRKGLLHFQGKS